MAQPRLRARILPASRKRILSNPPVMDAGGGGAKKTGSRPLHLPFSRFAVSDDLIRQDAVTIVGWLKIAADARYQSLGSWRSGWRFKFSRADTRLY
jgi:hypothetical protein